MRSDQDEEQPFWTRLGEKLAYRVLDTAPAIQRDWRQVSSVPLIVTPAQNIDIVNESLVFQAFLLGRAVGIATGTDATVLWNQLVMSAMVVLSSCTTDSTAQMQILKTVQHVHAERHPQYERCGHDPKGITSGYTKFSLRILEVLGTFDHDVFSVATMAALRIHQELLIDAAALDPGSDRTSESGEMPSSRGMENDFEQRPSES